jgi:hypothetical protein
VSVCIIIVDLGLDRRRGALFAICAKTVKLLRASEYLATRLDRDPSARDASPRRVLR